MALMKILLFKQHFTRPAMNDPTSPVPPPKTTGGGWRWEPPAPEELQRILPQ
jgi:hypothetical protein